MVFSSITFLYYFLPIVIVIYSISPRRYKNGILLVASLIFYGWGEPKYILFMGISILVNYILGLLIEKYSDSLWGKIYLITSVVFSLGMLGYFKYADFFIENINAATGLRIPLLKVTLPIGISFYTFQILSYTIDVYLKNTKAQKSFVALATYVAFFPQLIAGPIVRYVDIVQALEHREHSMAYIRGGIRRFLLGISKKVLIANTLGALCSIFINSPERNILFYWLYAVAFTLQIYFDFSGYSDMAIGLGKLFGFDFLENFDYPFISKSITEFWRRWHMSLGTWFRDYLYIPLGGNRVGKLRWLFNILFVWLMTGLWHGAAWNFVIWGVLFAILLMVEKLWLGNILEKIPNFFSHIYVMLLVIISFVIFDAPALSVAVERIRSMLGMNGLPLAGIQSFYYLKSYGMVLAVAMVGSTDLPKRIVNRMGKSTAGQMVLSIGEPILYIGLLLLTTAYLIDASFNPFLYFRF
ncbi:MBOAT family O-acyltransferase [Alkaliphilus oremlandii]|uniref:Membrane bound O-acyl transferase MBOAT family protein n=1 Tax=Alkaliphilus oremlandii (strain OhILAs) TaxID=350688 RepID=A8MEQ7_ALKOO|nr:MBOAT family O-acyltransferase [Alkaliphilus oremlandii]ABW18386.1 membrane bound O-acyl transferase MBOAT family protein [Alkaliphilus oremlandii OhILAs]